MAVDAAYELEKAASQRAADDLEAAHQAKQDALKAEEDAEFNARYGGFDQAAEDARLAWSDDLPNRTLFVDTNDYDGLLEMKAGKQIMNFYLRMLGMYLVILLIAYFAYLQGMALVPLSGNEAPSWVLICVPLLFYIFVRAWDAVVPVKIYSFRLFK